MMMVDVSSITTWLSTILAVLLLYLLVHNLQHGRRRVFPLLLQGKTLVRIPGYPIIGNLLDLLATRIIQTIYRVYYQYGTICELYLVGERCLFISDVEVAQDICSKRPKTFQRSQVIAKFNELMHYERSLFNVEGHSWGPLRRFISPSFNKQNLHSNMLTIWRFANEWAIELQHKYQQKVFDFRLAAFVYTTKTITKVAFDLKKEDDQYFNSEQFIADVRATLEYAAESAFFPLPRWLWKLSPLYRYEVDGLAANARMTTACQHMIDRTRQKILQHPEEKSYTLLASLLRKESEGGLNMNSDSDQIIIENVKLFYVAGTDTTSVAISWFPYYLTKYPQVAEKVRQEADAFYQKYNPHTQQSFDGTELQEMKYIEAFLNEVLRLSSPASSLMLQSALTKENVTLQCGLVVHPADRIFINLDTMNLDPQVFEDPQEFNPDRWLTSDKEKLMKMEKTFATFGHGPRICPGMTVALMESKFALVALTHYFNITLDCSHEDIQRVMTFTSSPNKLPVILTPRDDISQ